jgi:hypothetical protein
VRALARLGRVAEAEEAMAAYRKALPGAEGIAPVTKHLGDALVAAGREEDALARYREAVDLLPRPLPGWGAGSVQSLAETLVFLGRAGEARKAVAAALEGAREPETVRRLTAVQGRAELTGEILLPPPGARWVGGPEPGAGALRGKVVVHHLYAWWMETRAEALEDWARLLGKEGERGLVVIPVTRTGGWDPASGTVDPERKPEAEEEDIAKDLRARGWTGPAMVYRGEAAFEVLRVRGLPMEVVTGRDGRIRIVQAASDPGHALALRAALRALGEPPPAAEGAPPGGK